MKTGLTEFQSFWLSKIQKGCCMLLWFIQVILPLHHHRCSVDRKTLGFWSKLLWRSLTYQLLLNKHRSCQHSQITWKIREVLAYSYTTDVKRLLSCLLTRARTQVSQNLFCGEQGLGRGWCVCLFWLSAALAARRFQIRLYKWKNTDYRVPGWWDIFPSSPWGHRRPQWAQMQRSTHVRECTGCRTCWPSEQQKDVSHLPSITNEVSWERAEKSHFCSFDLPSYFHFLLLCWPLAYKKQELNCQDKSLWQ